MNYSKRGYKKKYLIPIIISSFFIILGSITLWMLFRDSRTFSDQLIISDLAKLENIFEKINQTAQIMGFEQEKNHINFLNVKSFAGSQIGGMNLAKPDKWQGPYLNSNLTLQEKFYQIIKNKDGYFIVPGDGVKLSNGKIIGKDIIFNKESDIVKMITDKNYLLSFEKPLAIKIKIGVSENNEQINLTESSQNAY